MLLNKIISKNELFIVVCLSIGGAGFYSAFSKTELNYFIVAGTIFAGFLLGALCFATVKQLVKR
jgi:hypothetical protein